MEGNKSLLILHGWGSDGSRWQKVIQILEQKGMRVIIPDLPGFGKSEKLSKAWSLEDYIHWLEEFVKETPELQNGFYLLGHSFGGALAAQFTIRHSQEVRKLFLCAAAAIRRKTLKKQVLGRISPAIKVFSFLPFYSLARRAFYKFVVGSSDYIKADGLMKQTFANVIDEDLSQKLLFIKVPVVILWGDKDDTTLVDDAYWIQKKIERSKLVIIPGADHAPYIHMPEILAEKILENI